VSRELLSSEYWDVEQQAAPGMTGVLNRNATTSAMLGLASLMNDQGRHRAIRERISYLAGPESVDRYLDRVPTARLITSDDSLAAVESEAMSRGAIIPVGREQDHLTHSRGHLGALGSAAAAVQKAQAPNLQIVGELVRFFATSLPHASIHLAYLREDPTRQDVAAEIETLLAEAQKAGTEFQSLLADLQRQAQRQMAEQQKQAAAIAAAEQSAPEPEDPETMRTRHKMKLDEEMIRHKMQMNELKTQQMIELRQRKAEAR
jgi:hypothetical protein